MGYKKEELCGYGLLVVLFIVIVGLIAGLCCKKDSFENSSPLVFTRELMALPSACSPWYGCNWETTPCKTNQDCESFRRCDQGQCIIPEKK